MTLEEMQADFAARMQEQHEKAALALEQSAQRNADARDAHHKEMARLKTALYGGNVDDYARDYYARIIAQEHPGDTPGAAQGVDGGTPPVGDAVDEGQPGPDA